MDDLTSCLYQFVCERRMGRVRDDPEYAEASRSVDLQTEKLKKLLGETEWKELDRLLSSMNALSSIENEYLFQATLGLVRELGRVGELT